MQITVIVKSYQRPFLLRICLESIERYFLGRDHEVIIADDGTDLELWSKFVTRFDSLFDDAVHSVSGEHKWDLCRRGSMSTVIPTCGNTWNLAQAKAKGDVIFLIEDDSYMVRPCDAESCADVLSRDENILSLIGLKERMSLDVHGIRESDRVIQAEKVGTPQEQFALLTHAVWPWSFDGIFYRKSDWNQIGPWPTHLSTGPMEGFIQGRLRELGWTSRPYGISTNPFCAFDCQNSVRTDAGNYTGRFRHIDAINQAWIDGSFDPTFDDVIRGALPWDRSRCLDEMRLHYPKYLRQINFVTGHELCGDLCGIAADQRWLAEANNQSAYYGDHGWTEVPDLCRSAP